MKIIVAASLIAILSLGLLYRHACRIRLAGNGTATFQYPRSLVNIASLGIFAILGMGVVVRMTSRPGIDSPAIQDFISVVFIFAAAATAWFNLYLRLARFVVDEAAITIFDSLRINTIPFDDIVRVERRKEGGGGNVLVVSTVDAKATLSGLIQDFPMLVALVDEQLKKRGRACS